MEGNVIKLNTSTTLDIPVNDVLDGAKGNVSEVMVIGWDGLDFYMASSTGGIAELNLWLDHAKKQLLENMADD